jgi:GNAT superfamily N-acetyltransferase
MNQIDYFKYTVNITKSQSNCEFRFLKNNEKIGVIRFHINYNEITIGWVCITPPKSVIDHIVRTNSLFGVESYHRKGYGTMMLKIFEEYIKNNHRYVRKMLLIPESFDGKNKNGLCNFYEKSGFQQETYGLPCYYKNLL